MLRIQYILVIALFIACISDSADAAAKRKPKHHVKKVVDHIYTVDKVYDGDTITIRNHTSKRQTRIRFL